MTTSTTADLLDERRSALDGPFPAEIGDLLAHCRRVVTPAMRAAVDRLDATHRRQASYHLGWTEQDGSPARDGAGGKAVRPALALLSAAAVGAPTATGLPGAVAVELVHNFSLLHDDVMDGDTERRHRPTVWARWGTSSAILCGDALVALASETLLESRSPHAAEAARSLAATMRELVRGQVEDLAFERRDDVAPAECLAMAAGKTGALLAAASSIGAVLSGGSTSATTALAGFGAELGIAFQLVDDLLGIWGDPAVTGKPARSDLYSRKKTLPVTYALAHGGAAGRELAAWLATPGHPDDDGVCRAADLVDDGGGRAWAHAEADRRMRAAEDALSAAELDDHARDRLVALGRHLTGRRS